MGKAGREEGRPGTQRGGEHSRAWGPLFLPLQRLVRWTPARQMRRRNQLEGSRSREPRGQETWGPWGQLRSSPRPLLQGVSKSSSGEEAPAGLDVWSPGPACPGAQWSLRTRRWPCRLPLCRFWSGAQSENSGVSGVPPYSIARGGEDRGPSLPPQEIYVVRLLQGLCRQVEEEPEPAGFLWPALSHVCLGRDRVCWREKGFWVPPRGV